MQLINVGLARSVWLFDINDLTPTGKNILPELLMWLGEKYHFQTFPKSLADLDSEKKGYLFKAGSFQTNDESLLVNFSIFSDGVVAETWASTAKSDIFIEEILRSATTKFGLAVRPETIRKKQYVSEMTVRLDAPLSNLSPRIIRFCETINGLFMRHNLPPFEMTGMIFGPDTSAMAYRPPGLLIERKLGVPFEENRFWSKSPFTTQDHLFALGEFEHLLGD